MVQAVTCQSDKQSVYFQGKLIVLENLTPILSPEEKKKRKREIENNLYDIFSKYGDRVSTNQSQHCRPGLLMVYSYSW